MSIEPTFVHIIILSMLPVHTSEYKRNIVLVTGPLFPYSAHPNTEEICADNLHPFQIVLERNRLFTGK
jgi:hypothetical protein